MEAVTMYNYSLVDVFSIVHLIIVLYTGLYMYESKVTDTRLYYPVSLLFFLVYTNCLRFMLDGRHFYTCLSDF